MQSNAHTHPIFFLSPGNLSLEKSKRKKLCDWLPDQGWEDIVRLMELFPNEFGSLADDIEKNPEEWKTVSGRNHQTHTRWTYGEILYHLWNLSFCFCHSGMTWMLQSRLPFQWSTRTASLPSRNFCWSAASGWTESIVPSVITSRLPWERSKRKLKITYRFYKTAAYYKQIL